MKKYINYFFIITSVLCLNKNVLAQKEYKKAIKTAEKSFKKKTYEEAVELYTTALKLASDTTAEDALTFYHLGFAQAHIYQFALGKENLNRALMLGIETLKPEELQDANKWFNICRREILNSSLRSVLMSNPRDMEIINMGAHMNSTFDDCCVSFSAGDTFMVFTSRRKPLKGKKDKLDGQYYEDFYYSRKDQWANEWKPAKNLGKPINTKEVESTPYITSDATMVYYYRYMKPKKAKKEYGFGGNGDIYLANMQGNKWIDSMILPPIINTPFWETHPFISPDNKTLYFVSNKPEGQGEKDIYYTVLNDSNQWAAPTNAGANINTEFDEVAPFVSKDGNTLYFSSNGLPGIGGYDIYRSEKQSDNTWGEPVNMGSPINTKYNDLFFRLNHSSEDTVFLTSSRPELNYGGYDIFTSGNFPGSPSPAIVPDGTLSEEDMGETDKENVTEEIDTLAEAIDSSLVESEIIGDELDSLDMEDFAENDLDEELDETEDSYADESSDDDMDTELESDIDYSQSDVLTLGNILFDFDKFSLREDAIEELNNVVQYLESNPEQTVELAGHTDFKGSDAYNVNLSISRAKTAYDYLIDKNVAAEKLVPVCYGESQPIADNGSDNGRQKNRRVQLSVTDNMTKYESMEKQNGVYIDNNVAVFLNNMPVQKKSGYITIASVKDISKEGLVFKVQVGAYPNALPDAADLFSSVENTVQFTDADGLVKYTSGEFSTLKEVIAHQNEIRANGLSGAFVIAFYQNEKITVAEALEILAQ